MTNPKVTERYPNEYMDILWALDADPTAVIPLECAADEVIRVRKRLYDFRNALVKDKATAERLIYTANRITTRLKKTAEGQMQVLVMHLDNTPEVAMLRAALKKVEDEKKDQQ